MQTLNESPTLSGVVKVKVTRYIQKHKTKQLFGQALELIGGGLIGATLIAPNQLLSFGEFLLKTNNFAIPKVVVGLVIFFGRKSIIRKFLLYFSRIWPVVDDGEKLLDDIPVTELVDYLLRNKHFKREGINGVRETFGLNMERFNRLAKKLEETKVLTRGENNSRILESSWSRQALIDYLSGEEKSTDLKPRFTINRIGSNHKTRLMRDEIPA